MPESKPPYETIEGKPYVRINGSLEKVYSPSQMRRMAEKNQDIVFHSIQGTTDGWLYATSAGH